MFSVVCFLIFDVQVVSIAKNDPDARRKYKECMDAVRRIRFEEAIASGGADDSVSEQLREVYCSARILASFKLLNLGGKQTTFTICRTSYRTGRALK